MDMAESHVVSALANKRAEIAGMIARAQQQLGQFRADLVHLDATIRLFAPAMEPETIPPKRRWCTCRKAGDLASVLSRYPMTRRRRTDFGRPAASIRLRTATPMAASVCCAAKPRARSRGPISAL